MLGLGTALIAAIVSAAVSLAVAWFNNRGSERRGAAAEEMKLIEGIDAIVEDIVADAISLWTIDGSAAEARPLIIKVIGRFSRLERQLQKLGHRDVTYDDFDHFIAFKGAASGGAAEEASRKAVPVEDERIRDIQERAGVLTRHLHHTYTGRYPAGRRRTWISRILRGG